jgi:hypothetical protein
MSKTIAPADGCAIIEEIDMRAAYRLSGVMGSILLLSLGLSLPAWAGDDITSVDWRTLVQLDYETGTYPETLSKLNGSTVQVPGFAVPLALDGQHLTELALVPQLGMCIHVPPPPPNQMVYVKLKERVSYEDLWMRPVWITGDFRIITTDSLFGAMGFTIANATVRPYIPPKKQ